jgi:hypothetical protein
MKAQSTWTLAIALVVCCYGVAVADEWKDESGKGRPPKQEYRQENGRGSYFHQHGYTRLDIPKGHYPPPGECRVWFPDRPAGQQPPPGRCDEMRRAQVPPGAWLIDHSETPADRVHVNVYDEHRPGKINVVGEFDIGSGAYVRIVVGK